MHYSRTVGDINNLVSSVLTDALVLILCLIISRILKKSHDNTVKLEITKN